jgi:hypothetical protein
MRHHPADRSANFGRAFRFGFHAVDLAANPFIERQPQLRSVRAHLVQFGVDQSQNASGDRGAQSPSDQTAALLPHTFLDRRTQGIFPAGQGGLHLAKDEAEHFLMPAAVDQAVQRPRDHLSCGRPADDTRDHTRENPPCAAVLHRCQKLRQHAGQCDRGWMRSGRIGQEAMHDAR